MQICIIIQQERKFAQICSLNRILHKYAAWINFCTNIQPKWKFAHTCIQNWNLKTICSQKSCYCQIRDFSCVRKFLSKSVAINLANVLVSSCLDYCTLLRGITDQYLRRLQGIHNTLCRIITWASRYTSITPHIRSLSWLPIKFCIVFKTCLISYMTLNHGLPPYLSQLLVPYTYVVNTRLSNPSIKYLLNTDTLNYKIHKSRHHFNSCFSFTGPDMWNSLPLQVCSAVSIGSFRKHLKKHLFHLSYPP